MANMQALIIGAGPTGMTAAIELRRAGLDVRIVDKSTHLARWSQALVVQARTLEQFQRYGIAQTAVDRGRRLTGGRAFSEGKQIAQFTFDQVPSLYPFLLFLPQSETEAILNEHMESLGVKAERGVELISLSPHTDGATAVLRRGDGSQEEVEARWVLGCDGAHSLVREICAIPFEGHGIPMHFSLADLEVEGDDKPVHEIVVYLHEGNVVFLGPLSDRLTRVIVARHAEGDTANGDAASQHELSAVDFQKALDEAGARIRILRSEWMTPFHVNDRQASRYRSGNILLAGDASHIHSPIGGQGMNTGIQDAANLCWKIAAIERGSSTPDGLLDSYEQERAPVGEALLKLTERVLKITTTENPLVTRFRDFIAPLATGSKSTQKSMAGFISETAIEYRSSPIVSDHGGEGELKAGDRLPDLNLVNHSSHVTLLGDWTSGRHLAIAIEPSDAQCSEMMGFLRHVDFVRVSTQNLDAHGSELLGRTPKLLLIRSDGYIGFRGPLDKPDAWRTYARQDGLL